MTSDQEMIPPNAADILRYAQELGREWGICKHTCVASSGRMCEVGLVAVAGGSLEMGISCDETAYVELLGTDAWPATYNARQALFAVGGGMCHGDSSRVTPADVLAKLKEAENYARKLGW